MHTEEKTIAEDMIDTYIENSVKNVTEAKTLKDNDELIEKYSEQLKEQMDSFRKMNRKARRKFYKLAVSKKYKRSKKAFQNYIRQPNQGSDLIYRLINKFIKDNPIREELYRTRAEREALVVA